MMAENQLQKPTATRNVRTPCNYNMPTYSFGSRSPYNKHFYYSTTMSFYHIRSREQAKYEAVMHRSVLV